MPSNEASGLELWRDFHFSARICLFAQRCGSSLFCAPSCAIVVLKACGFEFSDEAGVVILDFLVAAHVHAV